MKHWICWPTRFLSILSTLFLTIQGGKAQDTPQGVKVDASLRTRYEYVDWFGSATPRNEYNFFHTKAQFGLGYFADWGKVYAQGQYFQLWKLPRTGAGPGANYYTVNEGDTAPGGVSVRQLYAESKLPGLDTLSLQAGRFLYSNGVEVVHPNKTVTWLKAKRIAQRVIGPFDFTGGRSFDGLRADLKQVMGGTLTALYSRPTQGGFETNLSRRINDIDLATAVYTVPLREGNGEIQSFYYYYGDDRDIVKTDNRPMELRSTDFQNISLHNAGGHSVNVWKVGENSIDNVLWGMLQFGHWGSQDAFSGAFSVEGGYRFDQVVGTPWIRAGYTFGSGDHDPNDSDHKTFFQMLPTVRAYALTPFYGMANLHDPFVQIIWNPSTSFTLQTEAHYLRLVSSKDFLYAGAGANERRNRFGYTGIGGNGEQEVGTLLDIDLTYRPTSNLSFTLYYGHLFEGDVIEAESKDSSIDYGFVEATVKY